MPVIGAAHSGVYCINRIGQLIKANGVLADELCIVAVFGNDHVDQRQMESQVGARADWAPFGCFGGGLGKARVEIDHLCAAGDRIDQVRCFGGGDGLHQVPAGQQDVFDLAVIAARFFHAVGHQVGDDHGIETQAALRAIVGRSKAVKQVFKLDLAEVMGGGEDHRFRAIILL